MTALHDEATKAQFGCLPEDIYNITTGRLPFGSALSSVSSRSNNDDMKVARQPTGARLTHDLIEIGSSSDSELDDLFEDDDDDVDHSGDDCDEGGASMVDVGTSCRDLIVLVDVAVQTDSDEVRKQTQRMLICCWPIPTTWFWHVSVVCIINTCVCYCFLFCVFRKSSPMFCLSNKSQVALIKKISRPQMCY